LIKNGGKTNNIKPLGIIPAETFTIGGMIHIDVNITVKSGIILNIQPIGLNDATFSH
jgi:hypothetical protein